MGSARKQKEKKKDFQKTKLKVGKTKAKPSNYTDTSFTIKTISLPNQSISRNLDAETDLVKRLSLVKHHASQTRKETLIYIEQHLPENPSIYKQILTAIVPLVVDQSQSVRAALVNLLVAAAKKQPNLVELHVRSIILFIHSAMTHITPAIRNDSTKFLDILIEYGPDALVRSAWVKTLKSYFTLLNWTLNDTKQSVSLAINSSSVTNNSSKTKKQTIDSLVKFIRRGSFPSEAETKKTIVLTKNPLTQKYMIPIAPQPYAHLKLFVRELSSASKNKNTIDKTIDLNFINCEDYETRRKVLRENFIPQIQQNITSMVKEGGELGKGARSLETLISEILEIDKDKTDA